MQTHAMTDPIDGLPFWVAYDQLLEERKRAAIAEAQVEHLSAALQYVSTTDGVWDDPEGVEPGSPEWQLAFAWYDRVLMLKRIARNALHLAAAEKNPG